MGLGQDESTQLQIGGGYVGATTSPDTADTTTLQIGGGYVGAPVTSTGSGYVGAQSVNAPATISTQWIVYGGIALVILSLVLPGGRR